MNKTCKREANLYLGLIICEWLMKNKIENIGKLLYPEEIKNLTGALNIVKGLERKTIERS